MTDAAAILRSALADRYAIEREVGRGGMAVVYLARDLRHDRLVALKVLRPELALALGGDRFQREIRITAALKHPHILPLFDSGETDGILWYTTPFIEGESLRDRLGRESMLPLDDALRLAGEVADALAHAHAAGVVHRDIKPANILLLGDHALVADFGISRLVDSVTAEQITETGLSIGTPGYMSPEQSTGSTRVDRRSDVYSLGVVLYEMLAGELPFAGPNQKAIIARQLTEGARRLTSVRPNLPRALDEVVARALAIEPADRYQSADEMGKELRLGWSGQSGRPGGRRVVLGVVAGAALVAAGALWFARGRGPGVGTELAAADPRTVAVLPFASSGADTALERLGRDLVFTLSATLDGVGDLRTADAHSILAQTGAGTGMSIAESMRLARRLGAGQLVTGSLVRVGDAVRVDGVVQQVEDSTTHVRASFTAAPDSVMTLTDSMAQRVLPALLRGGAISATSLESALQTRSVPALRAFLEGEQLLAASKWDSAIAAFTRAHQADSTFWLAASRLAFALEWQLRPVPVELQEGLAGNLRALPRRERLELAAKFAGVDSGVTVQAARFRELVREFPSNWFGWFAYADHLMHFGPIVGERQAAARPMFARTLELNPYLVPAWDHDLMLAAAAGDAARITEGLEALDRMDARPENQFGHSVLSFRLLRALIAGDSAAAGSALDSVVADKIAKGRFADSYFEPVLFGFPRTQLALVHAVLARGRGAVDMPAYREIESYTLAAIGSWDSALALMPKPGDAYGLAVLGATGGAVAWADAAALAATAGSGSNRIFLDGVAAYGRRDRAGLDRASRLLAEQPGAAMRIAAEALAQYALALRGDSPKAGAALADLEWRLAERRYGDVHDNPFLPALNRRHAAAWLTAAGDTAQARRLLLIAESRFLPHSAVGSFVVLDAMLRREGGKAATREQN